MTDERSRPCTLVRSIAFYLPQYHPVAENDEWWGPGFTEWTNVARARPWFPWQVQPRVPRDLGFYDLRLPQARAAQAALARRYGIEAFCYYHYWFDGREILQQPLDAVLESGDPDISFCVCWANENWTRAWDGGSTEILLAQRYSRDDHVAHIRRLAPFFADPRYLTIEGSPVFLVYRAGDIPDLRAATTTWREVARAEGVGELMLLRVDVGDDSTDPRADGFDAAVEFQPHFPSVWHLVEQSSRGRRAMRRLRGKRSQKPTVVDYGTYLRHVLRLPEPGYPRFPGVDVAWDNTPRRGSGGLILRGSSPALFETWTRARVEQLCRSETTRERRLLFVNAWNEWAEGNYLEPDHVHGHGYLQAHLDAVRDG